MEGDFLEYKIPQKTKKGLNESVRVVVRCRPMSDNEIQKNSSNVIDICTKRGSIEVTKKRSSGITNFDDTRKIFTFDMVYDGNSTQEEIYAANVQPIVNSIFEGFNGCVFAYGQTGTGKTYTMEGTTANKGIIPRTFVQIWRHINECSQKKQFLVSVSYLEIYLEEIRDLLRPDHPKLEIREYVGKDVTIPGLQTMACKSVNDMLYCMNAGIKKRTIGSTKMNEFSSRSHAIFSVTIEICDTQTGVINAGKLNLIDLAGSERQSKSGASGDRLKEASKINRALSALGNVISALAENAPHVPYRDSKLTRLLQNSLGGNSKTVMIANIGPSSLNYDETLTTLRYAHRAKAIKNTPIKNEDAKHAKILEYKQEIKRLTELLEEKRKTVVTKYIRKVKLPKEKCQDVNDLVEKIKNLENQVVAGGLVEKELEEQLSLLKIQKNRDLEIQCLFEHKEDTTMKLAEKYTNLEQEAESKTKQIKEITLELKKIKSEINNLSENNYQDRRVVESNLKELTKELKLKELVIDSFVPEEDKFHLLDNVVYEENSWMVLRPPPVIFRYRPMAKPEFDQPTSNYAIDCMMQRNCPYRYKTENILNLEINMPKKTTRKYKKPKVPVSYRQLIDAALCGEDDLIEVCDPNAPDGTTSAKVQDKMDLINTNLDMKSLIQCRKTRTK